jgi:hypothetical protein
MSSTKLRISIRKTNISLMWAFRSMLSEARADTAVKTLFIFMEGNEAIGPKAMYHPKNERSTQCGNHMFHTCSRRVVARTFGTT